MVTERMDAVCSRTWRTSGAWIRDISFGKKGDGTFQQNNDLSVES
jgi:hypothetical protein